jgi:hypothetical protein
MLTKTPLSEQRLLVDRLMRIDQGYFERDQVRIVPTYHLICTQTGEKLAKIELVSTDKATIFDIKIIYSDFGVRRSAAIDEESIEKIPKFFKRSTNNWIYHKFLCYLQSLRKGRSFEETVISLFP